MNNVEVIAIFRKVIEDAGMKLIIKDKKDLKSLLVVLDPGHGGSDRGATFMDNGQKLDEAEMNHQVVRYMTYIFKFLESKGYPAGYNLTKPLGDEWYKDLNTRGGIMKNVYDEHSSLRNVLGFSVHHNGGGGDYGMYIHTIFEENSIGDDVARYLADIVEKNSPQQKVVTWKRKYPRQNSDYYAITRLSGKCPTIISEYAFVDNSKDNDIIDSELDLAYEAAYTMLGILGFYGFLVDVEFEEERDTNNFGYIEEILESIEEEIDVIKELINEMK